ncbi:NAD(P)H-dependent oxidoreductase [Streptococcus oricebi]|uniref:NAD(P)H-dependent oxidoreductase n=1 Tax=Streptococcus oricebi TaxID=1547447 RepID=A0ABS5B1X8_9STRE|nr:NAD(P)H-dependent oxidoreductase [Streptococcus oricebi]MBP2622511.1 NAD(P)H-dependent oxidoreductase [Streptococcus oricebi]
MSIQANEILQAFHFRYACKSFDSHKKIPEHEFQAILEAGRLSPSSFGFEPWQFLVIENQDLKNDLFPLAWGAQNSLRGASHFLIILSRKASDMIYHSDFIDQMMNQVQKLPQQVVINKRKAFENFQKEDFKLLENEQKLEDWASKQTYIALGNMLTVAALLKIDSCPIEGFNQEKVEQLLTERGILDSKHFKVSLMAGFGYRAETPSPKTRQTSQAVIRYI